MSAGLVTLVANGSTSVTVTRPGPHTVTVPVTVSTPATLNHLTYTLSSTSATVGGSAPTGTVTKWQDAGETTPYTGTVSLSYTSSNTSVATINSTTGVITLVAAGSCTFTVTDSVSTKTATTATLTVAASGGSGGGSGASVTSLFLRSASPQISSTAPAARQSTAFPTATSNGGTFNGLTIVPNSIGGVAPYVLSNAGAPVYFGGFVSDPLKAGTIPAGTYTLKYGAYAESGSTVYTVVPVIYVYRPSTSSVVSRLRDVTTPLTGDTAMGLNSSPTDHIGTFNLAAGVAVADQDVLIVEMYAAGTGSGYLHLMYGGNGSGAITGTGFGDEAVLVAPSAITMAARNMGFISLGPDGVSSSTGSPFVTPVPFADDAAFRATFPPGLPTELWYPGNTALQGTGASEAAFWSQLIHVDLVTIDPATTYTDRDGVTRKMFHATIRPSFWTSPYSTGTTLDPANDSHPTESQTPQLAYNLPEGSGPSGYGFTSWLHRRVFKFKNGWNMSAVNNTSSNADHGSWTVLSGGTAGVARISGVTTADQLKGLVFRVTSGTGTINNGGHWYQAIDTCDASGNITFHGYNAEPTATLDATSVLSIVGFNFTQSTGAFKLGPHPSNNNTRADLELANSNPTLDSGNITGTVGSVSARFNGDPTNNNYTIGNLTTVFGPNWATDEHLIEQVIAFRVTSQTTAKLAVWTGTPTDPTLTRQYYADVTFASGDYAAMTNINMLGMNFNRQLAASDPTPEWYIGRTQFADMDESVFAWPSQIPVADRF